MNIKQIRDLIDSTFVGTYYRTTDEKSRIYIPHDIGEILTIHGRLTQCYIENDDEKIRIYRPDHIQRIKNFERFRLRTLDNENRILLGRLYKSTEVIILGKGDYILIKRSANS